MHLPPALRHRRFTLLWAGLFISIAGSQMQFWTLLWHIRELTDQPIAVSGTSPGMGGTVTAQDLLIMLLSLLNARVMNFPRLTIPNVGQQADESGRLKLTSSLPYLQKQADAFLKFLEN